MVRAAALIALAFAQNNPLHIQSRNPPGSQEFRDEIIRTAQDERWRYHQVFLGSSATGTNFYVRMSDLARIYNGRQTAFEVWVFADHSRDSTVRVRETRSHYALNCTSRQYLTLSYIRYRPDQTVAEQQTYSRLSPYADVIPDTVIEGISDVLCPRP